MTPQHHSDGGGSSPVWPASGGAASSLSPATNTTRRLTKIWIVDGRGNGPRARRQPVSAHGWAWGSQREAARAMGKSDSDICKALQAGTFADLVLRRMGVKA